MVFDFCKPMTWSDIISAAAAVFTLLAVAVAFSANWKATDQLRAALSMQEQSKNVELLSLRMQIIDLVKCGSFKDAVTPMEVLFPQWSNHLDKLIRIEREHERAENDIRSFRQELETRASKDDDICIEKEKLDQLEAKANCTEPSPELIQEYQDFCNSLSIYFTPTGYTEDMANYTYSDLCYEEARSRSELNDMKECLICLMVGYVSDTIKPIVKP